MWYAGVTACGATSSLVGKVSCELVAIVMRLSSLFLPIAVIVVSTMIIYRLFSVSFIAAILLSVLVACTLTPAFCGSILQHVPRHKKGFFCAFNRFYRRREEKDQRGGI
ncbi:efflux RND transporter permease subunit [Escherichia coli]|uniref:efflux RND transporter permease subunit n=1 Tax=Escherichia coli TaxID=562 RepID=UPI0024BD0725|nr:efflux RND transporter permease subunit [Escherichia coli]